MVLGILTEVLFLCTLCRPISHLNMSTTNKPIILFVGTVPISSVHEVRELSKKDGKSYMILVLAEKRSPEPEARLKRDSADLTVYCNMQKSASIASALAAYSSQIVAVIARGENRVMALRRVIPHVPYISLPTESSLSWATDKLLMRQQFAAYDNTITPAFSIISDTSAETITRVLKKVSFPLVIKPAELAESLLVSICYHQEEFEKTLKTVFKKIHRVYKENKRTEKPKVMVEQFMEGEMYSVDGYVDSKGSVTWCPFVHIKTGKQIGFDDFFGYQQVTPTILSDASREKATRVAIKAVHALGMRSTTVHVELMRTEDGWKVIELGARIGGFRNVLYELTYGIHHSLNDLLNRMGRKPVVLKKQKGYAAAMKFFAKKEGVIEKITGLKKIQKLNSFHTIDQHLFAGDKCKFAKNGGKSVCNIIFFNKERSELLADVRRAEKMLVIDVKKGGIIKKSR